MADVRITQDVNVNIPQMADFGSVIEGLKTQLQTLGETLSGVTGHGASTPKDKLANESGRPQGSLKLDSSTLNSKLDELIRAVRETNKPSRNEAIPLKDKLEYRQELDKLDKEKRAEIAQERKIRRQEDADEKSAQSMSNWGKALLFGTGMAALAGSRSVGSLVGSQSNAVNAGAVNYTDYMSSYYNKLADTRQSLISGGVMAGVGAATMLGGPIGGAIGLGAGMLINYTTSRNTEQNKASTELGINQEMAAWRLKMANMTGRNTSVGIQTGYGNIGVDELQAMSLSKQYAPYATTLGSSMLEGKRDVISGLSVKDKNEYNKQLTLTAMALGTGDVSGLNKTATTMSSLTGESPLAILNKMLYTNEQYGGDTAANTAKLVQILETTPMGRGEANMLINKYQYNEPMLNNQIAQSTATPFSLFQKNLLMKLAGATPEELSSGSFNADHMSKFTQAQALGKAGGLSKESILSQIMALSMSQTGENLFAKDIGGVIPNKNALVPTSEPGVMKQFGEYISNALNNMIVNTQQVQATNVYVNGNNVNDNYPTEGAAIRTQKAFVPSKGLPETGTGVKNTNSDSYKKSMEYLENSPLTVVRHRK